MTLFTNTPAKTIKAKTASVWNSRGKNTISVLENTLDAIAHMNTHGDWTLLANVFTKANEGASPSEIKNLKAVVRAIAPNTKIAADKKQPSGYRIKFAKEINSDAVDTLKGLLGTKIALGGKVIAEAFKTEQEGEEQEQTQEEKVNEARVKLAKYLKKMAKELDMPLAQVKAMADAVRDADEEPAH